MNSVNLIGRIATDSKQNSGAVRSLLAVKRIYKSKDNTDADFIPLTLFGHQADNFIKFCRKGQQIGIDGSLKTGEYVDSEGQKRYSWSVVVSHFYLLSSDHYQQQPAPQQPYQSPCHQQPYQPASQKSYQSPSQQPVQPTQQQAVQPQQQLPKSSMIMPQSEEQQSKQWQILSKQLDEIEQSQQQPSAQQQPYQASQQQQGGIPFD
ncbi:single-stranded DNA-binding protein [Schleiferilactobacillus harbinensis]|uniref:single-stranded DNA-binding protein n=1 Tax=Schleiferilactobacillus harbinensis TaxID=304207 RepID=UPI0039E8AC11